MHLLVMAGFLGSGKTTAIIGLAQAVRDYDVDLVIVEPSGAANPQQIIVLCALHKSQNQAAAIWNGAIDFEWLPAAKEYPVAFHG